MRKWIPYVLAAVVGIGIAVVLLQPELTGGKKSGGGAQGGKPSSSTTRVLEGTAVDRMRPDDAARVSSDPPPPPGTLRPMNPAEEAQQKRESRSFNQHTNRVQSYWLQAARLLGSGEPELAAECKAMMEYVREQSRLDEGELDQSGVIAKELELVQKVRGAASGNPELSGILDYIDSSANSVIQGGDPTAIPKPSEAK